MLGLIIIMQSHIFKLFLTILKNAYTTSSKPDFKKLLPGWSFHALLRPLSIWFVLAKPNRHVVTCCYMYDGTWLSISKYFILYFFLKKIGFTPCKTEQPLWGKEFQEKDVHRHWHSHWLLPQSSLQHLGMVTKNHAIYQDNEQTLPQEWGSKSSWAI